MPGDLPAGFKADGLSAAPSILRWRSGKALAFHINQRRCSRPEERLRGLILFRGETICGTLPKGGSSSPRHRPRQGSPFLRSARFRLCVKENESDAVAALAKRFCQVLWNLFPSDRAPRASRRTLTSPAVGQPYGYYRMPSSFFNFIFSLRRIAFLLLPWGPVFRRIMAGTMGFLLMKSPFFSSNIGRQNAPDVLFSEAKTLTAPLLRRHTVPRFPPG